MRWWLASALALSCGEVHFVDPHAPVLFRATARFEAATVDEPLVWLAVLDLIVEDSGDCAGVRDWTLSAIRAAFARASVPQIEIPARDLAPTCRRRGETALDVDAIVAAIQEAEASFPQGHVRAIVVYADDIQFPMPLQVGSALSKLRASLARPPYLWALSFDTTLAPAGAERIVPWTFSGDPAMQAGLAKVVDADLPLRTATQPGPLPLLPEDRLATTLAMKLCANPKGWTVVAGPPPGDTRDIDPNEPPQMVLEVPDATALPKSGYSPPTTTVDVEGCEANCDRYYVGEPGDPPQRWNTTFGCLLRSG
jgi:hypothetical protein